MDIICLNGKSHKCQELSRTQPSETDAGFICLPFFAEPTFLSGICSSTSLLYFLVICPLVLFLLLLLALLCCYQHARKVATLTFKEQQKAPWVHLSGAGDRTTGWMEDGEEDN